MTKIYKKKCVECKKKYNKRYKNSYKQFESQKFCSRKCGYLFNKGKPNLLNKGKRNGQWKGDKVGYNALHDYIKYYIPVPKKCDFCFKIKKVDLANISGKYKRDLVDWEWLCRRCHMKKDGRADKLRFTGHKHSIESRKKISLALKGKRYLLKDNKKK